MNPQPIFQGGNTSKFHVHTLDGVTKLGLSDGYDDGQVDGQCDGRVLCPAQKRITRSYRGSTLFASAPIRMNLRFRLFSACTIFTVITIYTIIAATVDIEINRRAPRYSQFFLAADVDVKYVVNQELHNKSYERPVMENSMVYRLLMGNTSICQLPRGNSQVIYVLWVIKSSANHHKIRDSIRNTWGGPKTMAYVETRRIFTVGLVPNNSDIQNTLIEEQIKYGDIVQGDFIDTYYNNTIKMMTGFRFTTTHCPNAKYVTFADDDVFVSPHNLASLFQSVSEMIEYDFIYGSIQQYAHPFRSQSSKWYITKEEYPFRHWPHYPMAGLFMLPSHTLIKLDAAFKYTKKVLFDDVLVGFLADSLGIPLINSEDIYRSLFECPNIERIYDNLIGVHGIKEPDEMLKWWDVYEKLRQNKLWKHKVV